MLLIVTLGRLGAAITGDNAPRAVEEGLSIDEQGKRTTSVVHRSMTATDACSSLCAQNLRSTANMSDKQGRKRAFSRIESSSSRLPSWKKVKNFFRKQTGIDDKDADKCRARTQDRATRIYAPVCFLNF